VHPLSPLAIELHTCEAHAIRMLDCHVAQDPALLTESVFTRDKNEGNAYIKIDNFKRLLNDSEEQAIYIKEF
jgi:hypothetical protein